MKPGFRLCQFAPTLNRGDAMSGQVVAIHRAIEAANIESALFIYSQGDETSVPSHPFAEYKPWPGDVSVLHYGGRGDFEERVARLPGRVFLYYHNVTPSHFFERLGVPWAEVLRRGHDGLAELAHLGGLAASEYNQREMLRVGFCDVRVIPYVLDFDAFIQAANTPAAHQVVATYQQAGMINWLHVGRLAPNKRIEDIIRAFYVYHTRINRASRLFLVGSDQGVEMYSQSIRAWIERLGIQPAIVFTGQVSDRNQVAGFYSLADVYVCMSEHEGFCIPLLESMIHRVPIIAFRSTGVGYTLGEAGVLIDDKDPRVIAQIAHLLCSKLAYREEIIAGQLAQAEAWHPSRALQALYDWIETL